MKIAALDRLDWSSHQAAADGFWRMRMTASNGTVTEDHPCERYGTDTKIIQIRYDDRFASRGFLAADGLVACGLLIADKIDLSGKGPASHPYGLRQPATKLPHPSGRDSDSIYKNLHPSLHNTTIPIRLFSIIPKSTFTSFAWCRRGKAYHSRSCFPLYHRGPVFL